MYDAAELLRMTLFRDADQRAIKRFVERCRHRRLTSGEVLIREGEVADVAYLLLTGRLRVSISTADGEEIIGEVTAGQVVGEMALVTERVRSTTVRAIRESTVLEFGAAAFTELIYEDPGTLLAVTRIISQRLEHANPGTRAPSARRTVAVIAARAMGTTFVDTADTLCRLISVADDTMVVRNLPSHFERDVAGAIRWLHGLEVDHRFVVYVADDPTSRFGRLSARQADHVLIVDDAADPAPTGAVEKLLAFAGSGTGPSVDVILLHQASSRLPSGAGRWLDRLDGARAHHVRKDDQRGLRRVARVVAGRDVSVVLSGGGARGYAHLGVLRALEEAGIRVDVIGGSSFGAVVGGMYACLDGWEAVRDALRRSLVDAHGPVDRTLPVTALAKGERIRSELDEVFAGARLENLWLRFFCVTTDLTENVVRVHTRGSCSFAVRASISIPGVFPPMVDDDGHVLVDGSVMNNLPVDVMESFSDGGPRLAVNLRSGVGLPASGLAADGVLSGWEALVGRVMPFRGQPAAPRIIDVLLRSTEAAGTSLSRINEARADWVFRPPVHDYPLMDFTQLDALVDVGYRHALAQIESARTGGEPPWATTGLSPLTAR